MPGDLWMVRASHEVAATLYCHGQGFGAVIRISHSYHTGEVSRHDEHQEKPGPSSGY